MQSLHRRAAFGGRFAGKRVDTSVINTASHSTWLMVGKILLLMCIGLEFAGGPRPAGAATRPVGSLPLGAFVQIGGIKYTKTSSDNKFKAVVPVNCDYMLVGESRDFAYTGSVQQFTACAGKTYQLQVWGSQGSSYYELYGGYGGYATGIISFADDQSLYIYVGHNNSWSASGGYNGGGAAGAYSFGDHQGRAGGGATHVATMAGLLPTLTNNRDNIIIVAGGGGGAYRHVGGGYGGCGGAGGGYIGNKGTSIKSPPVGAYGGTQTAGGSGAVVGTFGQGATGANGGGGGWYGGGATGSHATNSTGIAGAGGGSGYINSSHLVSNGDVTKHMTCYSCATSSDAGTYTISNTCVSATATADCSKTGNGYARITRLE
ncbi:hypothetical protein IJJ12_00735 [bacterium]|nr:hypothetical protein [bacterium]